MVIIDLYSRGPIIQGAYMVIIHWILLGGSTPGVQLYTGMGIYDNYVILPGVNLILAYMVII